MIVELGQDMHHLQLRVDLHVKVSLKLVLMTYGHELLQMPVVQCSHVLVICHGDEALVADNLLLHLLHLQCHVEVVVHLNLDLVMIDL